jgi:gamma-glutamylcyclotransferase
MECFMYFAYGSNMLRERLQERTPSARCFGAARLAGHVLRWHKISKDGSGKCGIVEQADGVVWGVLYEIASCQKEKLDDAEGLHHGYEEKKAVLDVNGDGVKATTYVATEMDETLKPYCWYHELVCRGARQNDLPEDYIAEIEAVEAKIDPNKERCRKNGYGCVG